MDISGQAWRSSGCQEELWLPGGALGQWTDWVRPGGALAAWPGLNELWLPGGALAARRSSGCLDEHWDSGQIGPGLEEHWLPGQA